MTQHSACEGASVDRGVEHKAEARGHTCVRCSSEDTRAPCSPAIGLFWPSRSAWCWLVRDGGRRRGRRWGRASRRVACEVVPPQRRGRLGGPGHGARTGGVCGGAPCLLEQRCVSSSLKSSSRSCAQEQQCVALLVTHETEHTPLMVHKISTEDMYQHNGGACACLRSALCWDAQLAQTYPRSVATRRSGRAHPVGSTAGLRSEVFLGVLLRALCPAWSLGLRLR